MNRRDMEVSGEGDREREIDGQGWGTRERGGEEETTQYGKEPTTRNCNSLHACESGQIERGEAFESKKEGETITPWNKYGGRAI